MSNKLSLRMSTPEEVGPDHPSWLVVWAAHKIIPVFEDACAAYGGLATLSAISSILASVAEAHPDWTSSVIEVLRGTADVIERCGAHRGAR